MTIDARPLPNVAPAPTETSTPTAPDRAPADPLGAAARALIDAAHRAATARARHELMMDGGVPGNDEQVFTVARARRVLENEAMAHLTAYIDECVKAIKSSPHGG